MKFKLKAGSYREGGKSYKQGSVVESDLPLDEKFGVLKFQRLDGGKRGPVATTKSGKRVPDMENFDSDEEDGVASQTANDADEQDLEENDLEGEEVSGEASNSELNDMTIAELKTFADGDEIDLEGARNKPEILKVIRRTLKERTKANG